MRPLPHGPHQLAVAQASCLSRDQLTKERLTAREGERPREPWLPGYCSGRRASSRALASWVLLGKASVLASPGFLGTAREGERPREPWLHGDNQAMGLAGRLALPST